jgi:hypothetical protein
MLLWQLLLATLLGAAFYFSKVSKWVIARLKPLNTEKRAKPTSKE